MKVAVAINEAGLVSGHLGRCHAFRVFEVTDGVAALVEDRANQHPGGAHDCHHGGGANHGGEADHGGGHGHEWLARGVDGCVAVVAGCAGAGAVAGLAANGISVFRGTIGMDAAEAAVRQAAGDLLPVAGTPAASGAPQAVRLCGGHHGDVSGPGRLRTRERGDRQR